MRVNNRKKSAHRTSVKEQQRKQKKAVKQQEQNTRTYKQTDRDRVSDRRPGTRPLHREPCREHQRWRSIITYTFKRNENTRQNGLLHSRQDAGDKAEYTTQTYTYKQINTKQHKSIGKQSKYLRVHGDIEREAHETAVQIESLICTGAEEKAENAE